MGTNPFYTPPLPPNDTTAVIWIIVLCIIIVVLAGFLGWAVYKWRITSKSSSDTRYIVYDPVSKPEDEPLGISNTFN